MPGVPGGGIKSKSVEKNSRKKISNSRVYRRRKKGHAPNPYVAYIFG